MTKEYVMKIRSQYKQCSTLLFILIAVSVFLFSSCSNTKHDTVRTQLLGAWKADSVNASVDTTIPADAVKQQMLLLENTIFSYLQDSNVIVRSPNNIFVGKWKIDPKNKLIITKWKGDTIYYSLPYDSLGDNCLIITNEYSVGKFTTYYSKTE